MKLIAFTILIISSFSVAAENMYARLNTDFEKNAFGQNQCGMYSWLSIDGKRKKLDYKGEVSEQDGIFMCNTTIDAVEFEKYFDTCFLAGLTSTKNYSERNNVWGIDFSGLVERSDERLYWFEWFDAEHTNASYLCLLKNT